MTKKKNLTAFMIAIIVMLFSLPANAQGTVGYAQYDTNSKTLTFYGGEMPTTSAYKLYELNTGSNRPAWISDVASSCTQVKFDESFNDVRPTSCFFWFFEFSNLSTISDIRYLNTDSVKTMHAMFYGCSGLTTLDVSKFNTANVTKMDYMFNGCSKLTYLNLSNFNTANVEYMDNMFNGCSGLTTLDVSNFNTDNVKTMQAMFDGCSGLTSLNLSNFNTANVEYMDNMFNDCSKLTSLDLSSFNTANVTKMDYMFNRCSGLTSLDLSSFNTDKVGSMYNMFYDCSGLTSLDLSSFNTAKVTEMDNMFYGCSGLTKIYVSDDFTTDEVSSSDGMFSDCSHLVGAVSYNSGKTGIDMANFDGYFTKSNLTPYVKWDASTNVLTFKVANTKEEGVYDLNEGAKDPGWSIDDVKNNCTKVVFTSSFNHAKPTSCYHWFKDFNYLTTIEGIENLNTDEVTDMSDMFKNCSGLTSLTLSSFNTDKVENMSYMFYNCQSLESLILSSFNTANVTNMGWMFSGCSGLESLNLSNFNTANVTTMFQMFYECSGLTSLNLSNFDTAKVTDMGDMFYECSGLTSLNLSNFNTANVTTMSSMFNYCSGLTSLNLSNFNTDNVTDMSFMFNNCQKLTSLDLSNFDTSNVTNMRYMFNGCSGLTSLNLSSFNTAKVEDMYQMFWGCSSLESLNLSSFNTAKVTNMGSMFKGCSGLTSLNLSSFNTAKVENMYQMFTNCSSLTSLNLSSFNTVNVTTMDYMFNGCSSLESLNLSSFNTAKVTNMGSMFKGCSGLPSLDLSSFNTAKVEHMDNMFRDCSGLTKIYVSDDFTTEHNPSGSSMFKDCSTSLQGAATYNPANTDLSMANYTSGYFKTYFTLGENKVELCGNPLTTKSLNLSGDYDFTPKYEFKANEATYSRDLSTSGSTWFSLCLPFAYTPDNFTAYKLMSATADAVEIEEITETIAAGTPVLFKFKDGVKKEINISVTDAQIVKAPVDGAKVTGPDGSSLQLCGTYQTKTFSKDADGNAFILLNNKLMNPAKMLATGVKKVGVKPFRAYMTLTASAQTSSARAFSIGHGDEGNEGTAAIDLLNSVATDDAEYYDINGRRIDAPVKGVNIVRRGNKTMKLIIK